MSPILYEGKPRAVVWELTLACNLRCRHCASGGGVPRPDELTPAEAQGLCRDLKALGTEAVCLFGGEFHLREDWADIGRALRSSGIAVSAATNGWAFSDRLVATLQELELDGISVSLDAADPEVHDAIRGRKGAHARALDAVSRADEAGFGGKTIITSVSKANLDQLDRMPDLILSKVRSPDWMWMVNVASCHDRGRFGEDASLDRDGYLRLAGAIVRLRSAYRGRLDVTGSHDLGYFSWRFPDLGNFRWQGCRAGVDTLGIHSQGDVKGCLILPDAFVEGNLRRTPLADLWRDPERFRLVRGFRPEMLEGACRGCAFGEVCKGGCKDVAACATGSPYHFPFCLHRIEMEGDRK